jgi:hypothetical protein
MTRERVPRFEGPHIAFSRILHIEQVDLDRDGVFEALVDGIGTVRSLPEGIPTYGFVSRQRLPFESPLLAVLRRQGNRWKALFTPGRAGLERSGCFGHAVVYQPLREWDGEKSLWEIGVIRSRTDGPHECLAEPPLEIER